MISFFYCSVVVSNCLLLTAFIYGKYIKVPLYKKQIKWYIIYLEFILGVELITKILIFLFKVKNTEFLYPFYIAGEFFLLSQLFLVTLKVHKKWKVITSFITCCIFTEAFFLWFTENPVSTSSGKIFSNLIIVFIIAYQLIKNLKKLALQSHLIIIYSALFLYYSTSLFLFLLMNQLTTENISIWTVNNMLSSILYSSSIYAFYKLKRLL